VVEDNPDRVKPGLHDTVRTVPVTPLLSLTRPFGGALNVAHGLALQTGASVDQLPVVRHVVLRLPASVKPPLHEYVRTVPVLPVVADTPPLAGAESDVVQGLAEQDDTADHCPFVWHVVVDDAESV